MRLTSVKVWMLGGVIEFAAYGMFYCALLAKEPRYVSMLMWLLLGAPMVAAFVVAYFAPKWKIILGWSMSFLAAILTGSLSSIHEASGNAVDFPGWRGWYTLVAIVLIINGVLCMLGAFFGYLAAKKG
ncbi:hypothetical protein FACS1894116_06050 [Betaproteobacteria bacterium]|nr:hypothetical protein FACS1894116_06050 [Betaproteobacteria bacterium]GHT98211.1 hypothetical protein FACS1894154_03120 [Betaproteobacteria bacterium]